jgi:hypothetical protein
VVFSGDLAYDGTAEALSRGKAVLLDPLQEALPDRPLIVVPGNHDVDRSRINSIMETGLQHSLEDREAVNGLVRSGSDLAQAIERLGAWKEFETEWYAGARAEPAEPLGMTLRYEIAGAPVGVACLNTAWRAQGGAEDRGRLLLSEAQVDAALRAIDDAEVRIVVMHHPLDWLAAFDQSAARARFEVSGVFVLTGHDHTPDPTAEISTRGAALYGRAGCLYAGHSYSNSYTLLDLDARGNTAHATVRKWWEPRGEFAEASDLHRSGRVALPWPQRGDALPARQRPLPEVLSPLAEIAHEQSVLVEQVEPIGSQTVTDLLIPPRFWPVPHQEAVDPAIPPESRPTFVEPLEAFDRHRVVIVSGGPFSGVTSSMLWLVERHFRRSGTHMPGYVRIDPRMSLGRLRDAVELAKSRADDPAAESVPVILAVDDAAPRDSRALGRLVRFLSENPDVILLIGTHGENHVPIADTLREREIPHERVFIAPFGRRQLRELVARLVGPAGREVVQRVLTTVQRQRLPRNPLNIAALVSVLMREQDLSAINESGLLQSYVNVLLENPTGVDPEGLSMDYRRRELVLERLANRLVRSNRSRVPRAVMEQFVLNFFTEVGWRSASAGHLVDSLIRRRVLSEDALGVGFRYPALLHLFAAKWMLEDEEFAEFVLADPVAFAEIIRHAAGLRRNDDELLTAIMNVAAEALESSSLNVTTSQFDLIKDRHGWSQVRDLDQVRAMLEPPPRPPTEEELDEIYDEVTDEPSETSELEIVNPEPVPSAVDRVRESAALLAGVLQSSELVPDVGLKAESLKKVIAGWGVMTIVMAVREDETGTLRELFDEFLVIEDEERRRSLAEHLARVFVAMVSSFTLWAEVGGIHLEDVLASVLEDREFMATTSNALLATMLYALLEFRGWPERLQALYDQHGGHPLVRELVRVSALTRYRRPELVRRDERRLESLLVDILTPERPGDPGSVPDRAAQRAQLLEDIRASRVRARFEARARGESELEEAEDPEDEDEHSQES